MRADHDIDFACSKSSQRLRLISLGRESGSTSQPHGNGSKSLFQSQIVLINQDGRWRQHGHLLAVTKTP